jgi:hypothetical protein
VAGVDSHQINRRARARFAEGFVLPRKLQMKKFTLWASHQRIQMRCADRGRNRGSLVPFEQVAQFREGADRGAQRHYQN